MHKGHELGMLLRMAYLSFHRRVNARLLESAITADQFVVLAVLGRKDGVTQKAIALRTASDANTIAAILRLLEQRGLVERRPHERDRRARCVCLTEQGRGLLAALEGVAEACQRKLWKSLTPTQRQVTMQALAAIHQEFAAPPKAPPQRPSCP